MVKLQPWHLVVVEAILTTVIILRVPYTEIDWVAYMQEVEGFLSGELDYTKLRGDTGPLVYPAGFVYLFSLLYWVTDHGKNIFLAQCIYGVFYVGFQALVIALYSKLRAPMVVTAVLILSKRIHSIFALRMFNDCVAMFLFYVAVWYFCKNRWRLGCVFYSLGVSIKMNVLLTAPGLLFLMLAQLKFVETVVCLSICAGIQLILGAPFLATYPKEYLMKAFELSRVFEYKWTVNLKFLPEEIFLSKPLGLALLAASILSWLWLYRRVWIPRFTVANGSTIKLTDHNRKIVQTLFESNLVGIMFCRTLHYQFYIWFFHMIPFLLVKKPHLPAALRLLILIAIEVAFNVFPATWWSSAMLQVSLFTVYISVMFFQSS